MDVVEEILRERRNHSHFPKNCYIVENIGIDGILILQDEEGRIYELNDGGVKMAYEHFDDYISSL